MKIDNDFNPPILQNNLNNLSQKAPNPAISKIEDTHNDKVTISKEAREALLISTNDVNSAIKLIEKVSSSYPNKDLKLKINNIEIEASEPKLSTKISDFVSKVFNKIIK